jgi:tetratricopeptide (TPR) repeat protein
MFEEENDEQSFDQVQELVNDYESALKNDRPPLLGQDSFEQIIDYYEDLHESKKALEAVELALEQFPFSGIFYIRKAQLFIDMRRFDEAEALLDKAAIFDKDETSLHLTRADLLVWKGMHHEAIKLLKDVISHCDEDEKEDLYLELADIYEDCERYDKVMSCLKLALECNPDSEEALNRLWFCTELSENYADMIPFYQEMTDKNPYSVLSWFNLAHCYAGLDMWEKAIESFEFVLAIDEKFEDAYIDCADVYFNMRQYKKAIELYKEASRFPRPSKDVFFQIGLCFEKMREYNKARKYYRKASATDPEFDEAFFRIGQSYKMEKRYPEALSSIERAHKLYPDNVFYLKAMGEVNLAMERGKEGLENFQKIISLDGTRKWQWIDLAAALFHNNMHQEAIEALDTALNRFKKHAEILYARGALLYTLGRKKEAFVDLEKALSLKFKHHSIIFGLNKHMRQDPDVLQLIEQFKI